MNTKASVVLKSINEPRQMSEMQLSYLAGFVDGEGSIFGIREKRSENRSGFGYTVHMSVGQCNLEILTAFREWSGLGSVTTVKRMQPHHKDQWKWVLTQKQAKLLLLQLEPYLVLKKEQARLAIEFIEIKEKAKALNYSKNNSEYEHSVYEKLSELNHRGTKEIPVFSPLRDVAKKETRVCSVHGCNNKYYGHDLCRKHYRWAESKSMSESDKTFSEIRKCQFCNGDLPEGSYISAKFCSLSCKMKFHRKNGCYSSESLKDSRKCEVEGCDRPHHSKGMCRRHYMQEWHKQHSKAEPM